MSEQVHITQSLANGLSKRYQKNIKENFDGNRLGFNSMAAIDDLLSKLKSGKVSKKKRSAHFARFTDQFRRHFKCVSFTQAANGKPASRDYMNSGTIIILESTDTTRLSLRYIHLHYDDMALDASGFNCVTLDKVDAEFEFDSIHVLSRFIEREQKNFIMGLVKMLDKNNNLSAVDILNASNPAESERFLDTAVIRLYVGMLYVGKALDTVGVEGETHLPVPDGGMLLGEIIHKGNIKVYVAKTYIDKKLVMEHNLKNVPDGASLSATEYITHWLKSK